MFANRMDLIDSSIRLRFLCLLLHLFLVVVAINRQNDIAESIAPPVLDTINKELRVHYLLKDVSRFTSIYSVSIALMTFELLSFVSGISLLSSWQNQVSILCHFLGTCSFTYLLYYQWSEVLFYVVFIICTSLPAVLETFPIMKYLFRRV